MDLAEKYLGEASDNWDAEKEALKQMSSFMKDMKIKIAKAEKSIKQGKIDMNVTDVVMRMARIDQENFFDYFWS